MADTLGTHWSDGGGPEDYGWRFDEGGTITGYEAGGCDTREQALDFVPPTILDRYEKDGGRYDEPGFDLNSWLQDNRDLFRS